MLYIESLSTDPEFNLALEEHLFFNKTDEIFMLWQNESSIIVGKSQNAMAEIDYEYVNENGIKVVRRLTGGGAVYHDLGNLNFTYIVNRDSFGDYVGFTKILRDFLGSLGLCAEVSGRNDVLVNGKKISGNAQYLHHGRLLHHGTILIGADMSHLEKALRPDEEKIKSKGIRSVKSRVVNLESLLHMNATEFRRRFGAFVKEALQPLSYSLTKEDEESVNNLKETKYSTHAWNYGYSPQYAFRKKQRFPGGGVEVYLDIRDGVICNAKIFGDFLGDAEPLCENLSGVTHSSESVYKILSAYPLGSISPEELIRCFL